MSRGPCKQTTLPSVFRHHLVFVPCRLSQREIPILPTKTQTQSIPPVHQASSHLPYRIVFLTGEKHHRLLTNQDRRSRPSPITFTTPTTSLQSVSMSTAPPHRITQRTILFRHIVVITVFSVFFLVLDSFCLFLGYLTHSDFFVTPLIISAFAATAYDLVPLFWSVYT